MNLLNKGKAQRRTVAVVFSLLLSVLPFSQSSAQVVEPQTQEDEKRLFGQFIYSETSDATREELLELLDRKDPSVGIFAHALSMGVPIDEMLEAAIKNDSDQGRDYFVSAAFLLPLLDFGESTRFDTYDLDDMDKDNSAKEVIERFFDDRQTLSFTPKWHEGGFHLQVPVSELKELMEEYDSEDYWYREDDLTRLPNADRPIFIQLFSDDKSVLINDAATINARLENDANATLPVVFAFNNNYERPVSRMTQPVTVKSVIADYYANNTMVTPTPEWSLREYHTLADIDELYDVFNVPEKDDIDPERWQQLASSIQSQGVRESFIVTIMPGGGAGNSGSSSSGLGSGLEILGDGAVVNRLDKIAVAKELGFTELPVVFYYVDNQRVKPYRHGIRQLGYVAMQAGLSPSAVSFSGAGMPGQVSVPSGGNGGFGEPTPPPAVPPQPTPPRPPVVPPVPEPPKCPSPPCAN